MSVKIIPKLGKLQDVVTLGTLKKGDCFLQDNELYQLCELIDDDPRAYNFGESDWTEFGEDVLVVPVDLEIRWTKKAKKKGAKK